LAFIDPPKHIRIRKLLQKGFTHQVIEGFRPQVQAIVDNLLAPVLPQGEMVMVKDFAYQLPVRVVSMMLGVPDEDQPHFMTLMDELAMFLGNADPTVAVARTARNALLELTAYFEDLAPKRRANPGDDLISILLRAEEEGEVLDADELYAQCVFFLFAGHETTSNLIGNAMLNLLRNPDQMALLRQRRDLTRPMIEEAMRYEGPMQYTFRMARHDFELFEAQVRKKDVLVLVFGAANRDPKVFPNPDKFDITREKNPQLTFGYGLHHCIGAGVARMEAEVAYYTILDRMTNIRLLTAEPEWHDVFRFRGLKRLPLAFETVKEDYCG
jgi:cytochrome P450